MRIKSSVMLGILLSFMTLCAVRADSIVTSKSYVDAQDALKQNKITAQPHGYVVTYAGEVDGQAQFDAVRINNEYYEPGGNTDEVASTGLLLYPYLLLNEITNNVYDNEVLVRDANSYYVKGLAIFPSDGTYNAGTDAGKLATMGAVMASMASSGSQPALSGTNGAVVTYTNTPGVTGERLILDNMYQHNPDSNAEKFVTAGQIYNTVNYIGSRPISVMECTDPFASDDECLLWHISQRSVLSTRENYFYQVTPFIRTDEYPSYVPYNP